MTCYEIWSIWGQWISGIGTIIVSCVLGYFAIKISTRQAELSEQSLKIGLYTQRYEIYRKLEESIRKVLSSNEDVRSEALTTLVEIREDVKFLFPSDIHVYLTLVFNQYEKYCNYIDGNKNDEEYLQLRSWFMNQYAEKKQLRQIFERYLDLSKYGISM